MIHGDSSNWLADNRAACYFYDKIMRGGSPGGESTERHLCLLPAEMTAITVKEQCNLSSLPI
jgi:hypothetical protein